jgi:hypothetical protein
MGAQNIQNGRKKKQLQCLRTEDKSQYGDHLFCEFACQPQLWTKQQTSTSVTPSEPRKGFGLWRDVGMKGTLHPTHDVKAAHMGAFPMDAQRPNTSQHQLFRTD